MKKQNFIHKLTSMLLAMYIMSMTIITASAEGSDSNKITESSIFKGAMNLVSDLTTAISLIAIPVTIVVVIFCQVRKSIADETDEKKWRDRTKNALIAGIIAISASSAVSLITGYFS